MFNRKPKDQSQHPKHAEAIVPDAPKPRALQRRGRSLTLDGTTYSQFPPRWRIFISAKTVDIKPNALSILPCEIRDLVWTFAVGGKVLHLWTEYPILSKIRVKARACLANEPQYFGRKIGMRCHTCLHQRFPRRVIGAVSLLQTCRQVCVHPPKLSLPLQGNWRRVLISVQILGGRSHPDDHQHI